MPGYPPGTGSPRRLVRQSAVPDSPGRAPRLPEVNHDRAFSGQSSADFYSFPHQDEYESIAQQGPRSPNRPRVVSEHEPMLNANSPPPAFGSPYSTVAPNSRTYLASPSTRPPSGYDSTAPEYSPALSNNDLGDDPYRSSRHSSQMNLSVDDSSHRVLHPGMDGRRSSNLAAYGNKEQDDELYAYETKRQQRAKHAKYGAGTAAGTSWWSKQSSKKRKWIIAAIVLGVLVVAGAAAGAAAGVVSSKHNNALAAPTVSGVTTTSSAPAGVPTGASGANWKDAAYGGDGSIIYAADGSSFRYNNTFGGFWNSIPFNDSATPRADSPPLNQPWDFDTHRINGVNVGGWLVIEPFMVPSLFEPYSGDSGYNASVTVVDEWTLSEALGNQLQSTIEGHYQTFITERDFAQMAGAGLTWVRIPIAWWHIEVWDGEPFLANVGWKYFLQALTWARKYGLRVNVDLHAVPGSQNGYNHSGKQGSINFLNGVMGIANVQRTMNYIRTLFEFLSQPQYVNLVPMFSILNEPYATTIGLSTLRSWYLDAYQTGRSITGIGEGKGPIIVISDGFAAQGQSIANGGWNGYLAGADRLMLDIHSYLCFSTPNNDGLYYQSAKPCAYWAANYNTSTNDFGVTMAGEWSLAFNDCGKWINNVGNGARYDGTYRIPGTTTPQYPNVTGSCDQWINWQNYTQETRDNLKLIAQGHMDALRNWFYWNWKIGVSEQYGYVAAPFWSYQLGLEQGWMPTDPRQAEGICTSLVAANAVTMSNNPATALSAWKTGGAGAGTFLTPAQTDSYAWPPATIGGSVPASGLYQYTQTESIITLPQSTPTSYPSGYASTTTLGAAWVQPTDTASFYTAVSGCSYPNPWSGAGLTAPTANPCATVARKERVKRVPSPQIKPTPAPALAR